MDEVLDSLIVCCELAGGRFFMPMPAGWPLAATASRDAMLDPEAIDWFVRFHADNHEMLTG